MGRALQVLTGRATNPAALTAVTPNTGDSFTVRSFPFESAAELIQMWALEATAGIVRVRSPRLHDQAQGIRERVPASNPRPLLPDYASQRLYPQDNLTVEIQGGGAETDLLSLLLYYPDLPGVQAQLVSWDEIKARIVNLVGVERTMVSGATLGDYSGSGALNANFDTLKRNVSYAILGYTLDTQVGTIGITGPDTGNLRVAGPGVVAPELTADWFVTQSEDSGYPCIPVINAANVGATITDIAHTANAITTNVTFNLAELSS